MRVARVYKRTQVVYVVIDIPNHQKGKEDELFDTELNLLLDPAWETLEGSIRWMEG